MGWMAFILGLIIAVIFLFVSLINWKIQIHRLAVQLQNILDNKTKKLVTIALSDKSLERLAEIINRIVEKEVERNTKIQRREDHLKENISCLSHDLRTPLTSMHGYLKLLEDASAEKQEEYIRILQKKAVRLERLIDDFYQISLLEDGNYPLNYEDVDISSLLTETLLENYSLFFEKDISPQIERPEKSLYVYADKSACIRIMQNLFYNAVNGTSEGITVQLTEEEENISLIVKNPVSSLQIKDPARLFERFYTVDVSRNKDSSGQGLYIVKKLLAQMNCEMPYIEARDNCFIIKVSFTKTRK